MKISLLIAVLIVSQIHTVKSETQYNAETNLQALEQKIQSFKLDLQKLRQSVSQIQRTLANNKGNTTLSIASLQEGIANERDILYNIAGYLTLPFGVSKCDCYSFSTEEKTKLNGDIKRVKESIESLSRVVNTVPDCGQINDVKKEVLKQREQIKIVEESLNAACCGQRRPPTQKIETPSGMTDLSGNTYITNIKGKTWIYGGLTKSALRLKFFALTASRNVTVCPVEKPFASAQGCISCQGQYPYWDMSSDRCVKCNEGFSYSEQTQDCARVAASQPKPKEEDKQETEVVPPIRQQPLSEIVAPIKHPKIVTTITTTTRKLVKNGGKTTITKSETKAKQNSSASSSGVY